MQRPPCSSGVDCATLPLPPAARVGRIRSVLRRGGTLIGAGARLFHRATTADGAGRSGLSALTYPTMMNYAADAAIAVALANTLFFAAATAESRVNVGLYLLITVAPFALIAPVIGPLLDRLQHGRRVAMAMSFAARSLLLITMALHLDAWLLLYPAALGFMVLSKSFGVLKAAVTPRVLPPKITLVKTNSRLSVFGLTASMVFGVLAAGVAALVGSPGALLFAAAVCVVGAGLCLRLPPWLDVPPTEQTHAPQTITPRTTPRLAALRRTASRRTAFPWTPLLETPVNATPAPLRGGRHAMNRRVVVALWGNGTTRVLTGFLMLFVAFVVKAGSEAPAGEQAFLLGMIGTAGAAGAFLGNAVGSRVHFGRPDHAILGCVTAGLVMAILAATLQNLTVIVLTALVAATGSAIAKVCLDAVIQREMPEDSRASAFGRSETVLQLAWVLGGALGVLLPPTYWIGFATVSVVVGLGLVQTLVIRHRLLRVAGDGDARRGEHSRLTGREPDNATSPCPHDQDPHDQYPRDRGPRDRDTDRMWTATPGGDVLRGRAERPDRADPVLRH